MALSISKIWGFISGVILVLISIFQNDVKQYITSILGISTGELIFYSIVIILIIGIISSIVVYIYGLINKRKQLIRNLGDFLDQIILKLEINSTYEEFIFPEGFNYRCEIFTTNQNMNIFSKLRPLLGRKIKKYNRFCNQIDTIVNQFRERTIQHNIIRSEFDLNGYSYELEDRYERYTKLQIDELLTNEGLIGDKHTIEHLLRELTNKSQRLLPKFQRFTPKWKRIQSSS